MSLDEAIRYYSHLADECRRKADIERNDYMDLKDLTVECEQLADWLNELKVLREKIQKLLEKQEADRWIPVAKEGEPKESGSYLLTLKNGWVTEDFYHIDYGEWGKAYQRTIYEVVAWREKPEPYTEEEL